MNSQELYKRIENVCRIIYDPEIPHNIWDLGLIYSVDIDEKKNVDIISINGAIPAYSLAQSVARYKIEFKNIKNLKYVYLQIYSPALQYGTLGYKWRKTIIGGTYQIRF